MSLFTTDSGEARIGRIIGASAAALVVLILLGTLWPFASVGAGQRDVVTMFGKVQPNVLGEGLHVINPLASTHTVSLQTQTISETGNSALSAASNDLQDVKMEVVANFHLPESSVVTVYQQYQGLDNFISSKLAPTVREAVKAVSAQYTAEELVTKRSEVSTKIEASIVTEFQQLGVIEESFKITNLTFSDDFTKAIEAKVTAVQHAEAAKNKLAQVQYEAQQRVAEAKGEADAIAVQSAAVQSNGGTAYLELQAINKWDGKYPTTMLANGSIPLISIGK